MNQINYPNQHLVKLYQTFLQPFKWYHLKDHYLKSTSLSQAITE